MLQTWCSILKAIFRFYVSIAYAATATYFGFINQAILITAYPMRRSVSGLVLLFLSTGSTI